VQVERNLWFYSRRRASLRKQIHMRRHEHRRRGRRRDQRFQIPPFGKRLAIASMPKSTTLRR
jgi:hypothetical protein